MGIIKEIFGKVRIYQLRSRVDSRGFMSYVFDENIYDFSIKEARIYSMPLQCRSRQDSVMHLFHCKKIRYSYTQ